MKESNRQAFRRGFRDGIPIGLGYLAVSFSIGIAARNIGLNAFQGFLMSLLNNASAGEYAGLTVIAANSPYIEVAIVTLITNARYLLMSCAMSQRLSPDLSLGHRLLMSYDITDELFVNIGFRLFNVILVDCCCCCCPCRYRCCYCY